MWYCKWKRSHNTQGIFRFHVSWSDGIWISCLRLKPTYWRISYQGYWIEEIGRSWDKMSKTIRIEFDTQDGTRNQHWETSTVILKVGDTRWSRKHLQQDHRIKHGKIVFRWSDQNMWTCRTATLSGEVYPLVNIHSYLKWPLVVDSPPKKRWLSIVMFNYQRVSLNFWSEWLKPIHCKKRWFSNPKCLCCIAFWDILLGGFHPSPNKNSSAIWIITFHTLEK